MGNPNKLNSFTLRGQFVDRSSGVEVPITFVGAANALLNNSATIGKVTVLVTLLTDETAFQTTNDGQTTFTLDGSTYCMLQTLNGSQCYFTLWGGLPAGDYIYWMEYTGTSGSVWHPRLSTTKRSFSVNKENVTFH